MGRGCVTAEREREICQNPRKTQKKLEEGFNIVWQRFWPQLLPNIIKHKFSAVFSNTHTHACIGSTQSDWLRLRENFLHFLYYCRTQVSGVRSMGPGVSITYKSFGGDFADVTLADDDTNSILLFTSTNCSLVSLLVLH